MDGSDKTYLFPGEGTNKILQYSSFQKTVQEFAEVSTGTGVTSSVFDPSTGNAYVFGGYSSPGYLNDIIRMNSKRWQCNQINATLHIKIGWTCSVWTGKEAYIIGGFNRDGPVLNSFIKCNPSNEEVELIRVNNYPTTIFLDCLCLHPEAEQDLHIRWLS